MDKFKKGVIDTIIDDLPNKSLRENMTNEEWYGWFEEVYDIGKSQGKTLPIACVSNSLAVGTRILSDGEEHTITDNTEIFDNQTAYRLGGDMNALWMRQDFDYVIANDC